MLNWLFPARNNTDKKTLVTGEQNLKKDANKKDATKKEAGNPTAKLSSDQITPKKIAVEKLK